MPRAYRLVSASAGPDSGSGSALRRASEESKVRPAPWHSEDRLTIVSHLDLMIFRVHRQRGARTGLRSERAEHLDNRLILRGDADGNGRRSGRC